MKLSLEQRAFLAYALANLGGGMVLAILLTPEIFLGSMLAHTAVVVAGLLLLILLLKMDYDAYRLGLVGGFCNNSRFKQTNSHEAVIAWLEASRKHWKGNNLCTQREHSTIDWAIDELIEDATYPAINSGNKTVGEKENGTN